MKKHFTLKSLWLALGLLWFTTSLMAQSSITIDASQVFSTFKFTDGQGNQDKSYSRKITGSYSVGYLYTLDNGLMLRGSIGMSRAGATLLYDSANYSWDLQYASVKLGIGYMYNKGEILKPYIAVSPYFSYLLKGNQVLNNQNFDVVKSKSLKTSDYGFSVSPGLQVKVSYSFSLYAEFNYIMGLMNIENSTDGQKTYNRAYAFTLGAVITLK